MDFEPEVLAKKRQKTQNEGRLKLKVLKQFHNDR